MRVLAWSWLKLWRQRLTVIATPHTAGPDLFTNGVEGFLVPICSAEAIAGKAPALGR